MKTPAPAQGRLSLGQEDPHRVDGVTGVLQDFWDEAPVGLGVVDTHLRFVRVNDSLARLLRRPREQILGHAVALATAPFGPAAARACREVLRSGRLQSDFLLRPCADCGADGHGAVKISVAPLSRTECEHRHVAIIVEDATRQLELQESLDRLLRFEQLISDLLAQFADIGDDDLGRAICAALGAVGRFLDVDRIAVSESDAEAIVVLHSWAAPGVAPVTGTFRISEATWYLRQLLSGRTVSVERAQDLPADASQEREMMRRRGVLSHLAIPIRLGHGLVETLSLDLTRGSRAWPPDLITRLRLIGQIFAAALGRKRAHERFARQQQELAHVGRVAVMGELASILAHDLNQPLAAILTNAQATRRLIEKGDAGASETDEALADIADDANRAGEIIRRLRNLLRKGVPTLSSIDVNRLLADIEPIVSAELREYEVALKLELADRLPAALADAVQIQQVLLNLVSNACHAMVATPRDQRELVIRTSRSVTGDALEREMIHVEVCDSGPPIPRPVFECMFAPFFTTKPGGLGMGLAITRSIVTAHRGTVWATQNSQRGITIHLTLPVCS